MKDRHQFHRLYKLSLIIVLIIGVLVPYFSEQPAMASEENSGDSGFLIHSEKVEGEMNLLGAALGKIDIRSGTIEGLTIVSKLGTPSGPMTTQITSEGPVPVENLKATTAGHSFPEIGGFCGVDVLSVFNNGNLEQVLKNTSLNQIKLASETMGYDLIKLLSQANGPDIDYEEFFNTTGDLPLTESLELLTELLREKGYEPNVDLSNPFTKQEIAELMDVLGVNVGLNQILNAVQPEPIFALLDGINLGPLYVDVCLEDVTMKVVEQSVENISLPDTEIKTCYKEECDIKVSQSSSESKLDQLKNLPEIDQNATTTKNLIEEQKEVNETKNDYEKDKERLNNLQTLLDKANNLYSQIQNRNYLNEIDQSHNKIDQLLKSNEGKLGTKLKSLSNDVQNQYDSLYQNSSTLVKLMNQVSSEIDSIKERMDKYESFIQKSKDQKKGETYYTLIQLIYEKYGDSQARIINQTELVKELEAFIEEFNKTETRHQKLSDQSMTLLKEVESVTKDIATVEKKINGITEVEEKDRQTNEESKNEETKNDETTNKAKDIVDDTKDIIDDTKEKITDPVNSDQNKESDESPQEKNQPEDNEESDEDNQTDDGQENEEEDKECFKLLGLPLFCN